MALFPPNVEYALVDVPRSRDSKIYVVDPVHGSDANPGTKFAQPLASLEAAYAKTVSLHNDVILLVGGATAFATTAALTWANHYTHLIGLSADLNEPRVIVNCPAALATTPFVTWSANGCVVKNVVFRHNTSNAAGLVDVHITGSYNLFKNCQFAGGVGANAAAGMRALSLSGAVGNTFSNCMIGTDETAQVDGGASVVFLALAAHNTFRDCTFLVSTAGTTYVHGMITAAADIGALNQFIRCNFYNTGAGVQAENIIVGAALSGVKRVFVIDCWMYGITEWNLSNNGVVTNVMIAANHTGVATGNIMKITS